MPHASTSLLAASLVSLTAVAAGTAGTDAATDTEQPASTAATAARPTALVPDDDNGGLTLAAGFRALVVHEGVGATRHITVRDDGTIYAAMRRNNVGGGVAVITDADGDGRANEVVYACPEVQGTGIALRDEYLYFGTDDSIVRYRLPASSSVPSGEPEVIVQGLLNRRQHAAKPITFDGRGGIYVTVGAPSNACQEQARTPGSPGLDPCPQLDNAGGIWRFDADTPGQSQSDGIRYASGLRHCVAIQWNDAANDLYVVQHGRDQLNTLYPGTYTAEMNAELPAEEFHRVTEDYVGGWPYTYWNHLLETPAFVVAPEYGGDGKRIDETGRFSPPIQAFPGHWAPNGLEFMSGDQFPERYRNGAFIAWHGSWNRAPLRQGGYKVTFTPMGKDGLPSGDYEVFADGFAGVEPIMSPRQAAARPMGLAVGPDGSLFVADSLRGKIWRIFWVGEEATETRP